MPDDRPPIRSVTARPPPRDTIDQLRDLARDLERMGDRFDAKLERGVESFTGLRKDLEQIEATAKAANATATEAAKIRPIPWVRVFPIILSVLVLAGTILVTFARAPQRDEYDSHVADSGHRARDLQGELVALQKDLIALRAAVEALRSTVADTKQFAVERCAPTPQPRRRSP